MTGRAPVVYSGPPGRYWKPAMTAAARSASVGAVVRRFVRVRQLVQGQRANQLANQGKAADHDCMLVSQRRRNGDAA
jgi:hypothetical protein